MRVCALSDTSTRDERDVSMKGKTIHGAREEETLGPGLIWEAFGNQRQFTFIHSRNYPVS